MLLDVLFYLPRFLEQFDYDKGHSTSPKAKRQYASEETALMFYLLINF